MRALPQGYEADYAVLFGQMQGSSGVGGRAVRSLRSLRDERVIEGMYRSNFPCATCGSTTHSRCRFHNAFDVLDALIEDAKKTMAKKAKTIKEKLPKDQYSREARLWGVQAIDHGELDESVDDRYMVVANCATAAEAVRSAIQYFSDRDLDLPKEWSVQVLKNPGNVIEPDYGGADGLIDFKIISGSDPDVMPDRVLDSELQKLEQRLVALNEEAQRRSAK